MASSNAIEEFQIDEKAPVSQVIEDYSEYLRNQTHNHLGYPYNLSYDHSELDGMLNYSINNLGDPFQSSNYRVHSRAFEVAVLDFFSKLWKIPRDEYWGYVTSCGTEGNLHGMYIARECLPAAILYLSSETHYSILKSASYYKIEACVVDSLKTGEIDYEDFERKLLENKKKGFYTAIVNVNCGTTVKGAVDNIDHIEEVLNKHLPSDQFHIHVDGALFGMILPYVASDRPAIDFQCKGVQSISVSGHKMMGCPMPCGVILHRKENIERISNHIPYLNSPDTTIMGSRNGHASLYMWLTIQKKGVPGFTKDAEKCVQNAKYLASKMKENNIGVMLNLPSNTVVFEKPKCRSFILKWQLACLGSIAHVVVMPSSTIEKLDTFFLELKEERKRENYHRCIEKHCGKGCCCCLTCQK